MAHIITRIFHTFKQSRYTWLFFTAVFLSVFVSIWIFYWEIVKDAHSFSSIPNHILKTLLDAAIITTPLWVVKRRGWVFFPLILLDIFCLCSVWYYRNYLDIIPLSSFLLVENLNSVLVKSTLSSMRRVDLWIILPTLLTGIGYKLFWQRRVREERQIKKRIWWPLIASLILYLSFYSMLSIRDVKSGNHTSLNTRFMTAATNIVYFDCNGMCAYLLYQAISLIPVDNNLSIEERAQIDTFIQEQPLYTDILIPENKGKNLVLILVESLNSWVIGKRINGLEVTPSLNRLVNDSNSIVALHILSQAKDGRSSDGQFIVNTGLLPLRSGAVISKYDDITYYTLPKALKNQGYTTTCITIDNRICWNQEGACTAYGYNRLIDRFAGEDMNQETTCDSLLMKRAVINIKAEKRPFFYQLITGDSHSPYSTPEHPTALSDATEYPPMVRNYMETIHLVDNQIGRFVEALKSEGLYENTVLAIVSDHSQLLAPCEVDGYNDTEVAFIVANAGVKYTHDAVMGQIDIFPTLLDIMGCNNYPWKGLGYSILRTPIESAVGWNRVVYGNRADTLSQRRERAWDISSMMVIGDYFAQP